MTSPLDQDGCGGPLWHHKCGVWRIHILWLTNQDLGGQHHPPSWHAWNLCGCLRLLESWWLAAFLSLGPDSAEPGQREGIGCVTFQKSNTVSWFNIWKVTTKLSHTKHPFIIQFFNKYLVYILITLLQNCHGEHKFLISQNLYSTWRQWTQ